MANHLLLPQPELLPDRERRAAPPARRHTPSKEAGTDTEWCSADTATGNSKTDVIGYHFNTPSCSVLVTVLLTRAILLFQHMPLPWPSVSADRNAWAQSQVPAPHSMYRGSRNIHALLPLPGNQWVLDSIYRFLPLTTQTTSNFQYIRSLCSSGADDKGKVSGSQRTVCTQQPVMQKLSSSCKIASDTSRNSHQISSLSEWIINTSDPIIQVLSVFQLPNQTIQLHTWCNFNNIRPQRAMEHNSESRQGNIDFQIAFHYKHQTAGGLSEI